MANPTTAVILAAGLGERLGALGMERPKGFIELDGKSLIEMSLARLAAAGVSRTLVVTGHQATFYEELARRLPGIALLHNPRYAASGSMYSLYLARDWIADDVLLLESDLIYEERALDVLARAPEPNTLLVSGPTRSGDEVYVEASGKRLTGVSKRREDLKGSVVGELVGITRVTPRCVRSMCAYAGTIFERTLKVDYEHALVAAARELPVECAVVDDLLWTEIDDENHLHRARTMICPAIRAREAELGRDPARTVVNAAAP